MSTSTQGIISSFESNLLNNKLFYSNPQFLVFLNNYLGVVRTGYVPSRRVLNAVAAFDLSTLDANELTVFEQLQGKLLGLNIYQTTTLDVGSQFNGIILGTSYADSIVVRTIEDGIFNNGTIDTGAGNDTITASSGNRFGITNRGTIDTGAGNDTITVSGRSFGIDNSGTINTGDGNDTITASSNESIGIFNNGTIDTGAGDDTIMASSMGGSGSINTGDGNDTITLARSSFSNGPINTGNGNDTITFSGDFFLRRLSMGAGNDIIDALTGRITGSGNIDLGAGDDTLKSFGTGNFDGGTGADTIILGTGTYTITEVSFGFSIAGGGTYLNFEQIGGTGSTLALVAGLLTIDANGFASLVGVA